MRQNRPWAYYSPTQHGLPNLCIGLSALSAFYTGNVLKICVICSLFQVLFVQKVVTVRVHRPRRPEGLWLITVKLTFEVRISCRRGVLATIGSGRQADALTIATSPPQHRTPIHQHRRQLLIICHPICSVCRRHPVLTSAPLCPAKWWMVRQHCLQWGQSGIEVNSPSTPLWFKHTSELTRAARAL